MRFQLLTAVTLGTALGYTNVSASVIDLTVSGFIRTTYDEAVTLATDAGIVGRDGNWANGTSLGGSATPSTFTATFSYETSTAPSYSDDTQGVWFSGIDSGLGPLSIVIDGTHTISSRILTYPSGTSISSRVNLRNDAGNPWYDNMTIAADNQVSSLPIGSDTTAQLRFQDGDQLAFSSNTQLPDFLLLEDFSYDVPGGPYSEASLFFRTQNGDGTLDTVIQGTITDIVVEGGADVIPVGNGVDLDLTEVIAPDTDGGGLAVDLPSTIEGGHFTATYEALPVSEVDFSDIDFFIPGAAFQLWNLNYSGTLADGELTELVFNYDDTGMTDAQEALLDIFHFENGFWTPLGGTVDTINNTITAFTETFSPFGVGLGGSVPSPATLLLFGAGLFSLGLQRKGLHRDV